MKIYLACPFFNDKDKKIVIVHCDYEQESSLMIVNGCSLNIENIEKLKTLDFDNLNNNNFFSHTSQK